MNLSVKYLKSINACRESIFEFEAQTETNPVKVLNLCLKQDKIDWANWLIVRLLNRKNSIRYAIFAAEKVLPLYEKNYPNDAIPRKAIEAAIKILENYTKENRNRAIRAAEAAIRASHAAYAARAVHLAKVDQAAADIAEAATRAADSAARAAYAAADVADSATRAFQAAQSTEPTTKEKIIRYGIELLKKQLKEEK